MSTEPTTSPVAEAPTKAKAPLKLTFDAIERVVAAGRDDYRVFLKDGSSRVISRKDYRRMIPKTDADEE